MAGQSIIATEGVVTTDGGTTVELVSGGVIRVSHPAMAVHLSPDVVEAIQRLLTPLSLAST